MPFPYTPPFRLEILIDFVAKNCIGKSIYLTDKQYAWYAGLVRKLPKDVEGVPIVFSEGKGVV